MPRLRTKTSSDGTQVPLRDCNADDKPNQFD
jgi:hypothetical protein